MLHFSQSGHFPRHRHLHFPTANHVATRLTPNQTSHEFLRPRYNIAYNKPKQLWILPVTWQYGLHQTKSALNSSSHVAKWLTPNQTSHEFFQSRGNMANKANQQWILPATWRLELRRSKSAIYFTYLIQCYRKPNHPNHLFFFSIQTYEAAWANQAKFLVPRTTISSYPPCGNMSRTKPNQTFTLITYKL